MKLRGILLIQSRNSKGKMVKELTYRTTLGHVGARILTLIYLANIADEDALHGDA